MVSIHRLDGREITVNADMIVTLEATPDTLITLSTGDKWTVRESVEEVVERVIAYRRKVASGPVLVRDH